MLSADHLRGIERAVHGLTSVQTCDLLRPDATDEQGGRALSVAYEDVPCRLILGRDQGTQSPVGDRPSPSAQILFRPSAPLEDDMVIRVEIRGETRTYRIDGIKERPPAPTHYTVEATEVRR